MHETRLSSALATVQIPRTSGRNGPRRAFPEAAKRPSRELERDRDVVRRAVPRGSSRAASQAKWLEVVKAHRVATSRRADAAATLVAIATALAHWAEWESMTSRPTWEVLMESSGKSRSTVARVLRALREAGLVGIVATGRSAGYTPMALDEGRAEAALYVLAVPSPVRSAAQPASAETSSRSPIDDTPTALLSGEPKNPLRGRARSENPQTEPLRGAQPQPGGSHLTSVSLGRYHVVWSRHATTSRKDERRAAALALKRQLPVLRRLTDANLAHHLREFMLAGWTNADIQHAIDHRPDGTPWPHSGAEGVKNPGAWLDFRLSAWRDSRGTVGRSRTQRIEAARAEERAAHRAADERRRQERQNRVPSTARSPQTEQLLAQARAAALASARKIRGPR